MKKELRHMQLKHVVTRLNSLKTNDMVGKPAKGWIRFIREALNMSSKALAKRVGISSNTLSDTEKAELEESITLKRLRKVADSLNCDLVYYLLPREEIQKMIDDRARHISLQKIIDAQGHMELEDQAVSQDFLDEKLKDEIDKIKVSKKLWDE